MLLCCLAVHRVKEAGVCITPSLLSVSYGCSTLIRNIFTGTNKNLMIRISGCDIIELRWSHEVRTDMPRYLKAVEQS